MKKLMPCVSSDKSGSLESVAHHGAIVEDTSSKSTNEASSPPLSPTNEAPSKIKSPTILTKLRRKVKKGASSHVGGSPEAASPPSTSVFESSAEGVIIKPGTSSPINIPIAAHPNTRCVGTPRKSPTVDVDTGEWSPQDVAHSPTLSSSTVPTKIKSPTKILSKIRQKVGTVLSSAQSPVSPETMSSMPGPSFSSVEGKTHKRGSSEPISMPLDKHADDRKVQFENPEESSEESPKSSKPIQRGVRRHLGLAASTVSGDTKTMPEFVGKDDALVIPKYCDSRNCYDAMPLSVKVIILDVRLKVEKAFHSLIDHGIRAAPVWDSIKYRFIGMLTITDFVDILTHYYESSEDQLAVLENQTILMWRNVMNKSDKFIYLSPDVSLREAVRSLIQHKVHRLPIIEPVGKSVIYSISHKRILKYLYYYAFGHISCEIYPLPSCLKKTIGSLELGTYGDIATATLETPLLDVLKMFKERKISAIPIVQNKLLLNIYAKFDVLALANEKSYQNLNMTVKQAIEVRGEAYEKVAACIVDDTLGDVISRMMHADVHRLVIIDSQQHVIGMLSVSDILKCIVLKPLGILDVPVMAAENVPSISEGTGIDCSSTECEEIGFNSNQPNSQSTLQDNKQAECVKTEFPDLSSPQDGVECDTSRSISVPQVESDDIEKPSEHQ